MSAAPTATDLYSILGVRADANGAALRAAFLSQAKATHPDRVPSLHGSEAETANAAAIASASADAAAFLRVREAYEVLSDNSRRQQYDAARSLLTLPSYPRAIADDVAACDMEKLEGHSAARLRSECRCGGEYIVSISELASAGPDGLAAPCSACSLWVRVVGLP